MNIEENKQFSVMNSSKILENALSILKELKMGNEVYTFFDTETTGTEPYGDKNDDMKKDRLIEFGAVSYVFKEGVLSPLVNDSGEQVFFHEYINPFAENDNELFIYNSKREMGDSFKVHGISKKFLEGKDSLAGFTLKQPAKPFTYIRDYVELYMLTNNALNFIIENEFIEDFDYSSLASHNFVAHNAAFDKKVMNAEFEKDDRFNKKSSYLSDFEGNVRVIDSLLLAREVIPKSVIVESGVNYKEKDAFGNDKKPGYSLDYIQYYYDIKADRELHGALVDSKILAEVYKSLISDSGYRNAPNSPLVSSNVSIAEKLVEKEKRIKITADKKYKKVLLK